MGQESFRPVVRQKPPKMLGIIDIAAYSAIFYFSMIIATGIHLTLVCLGSTIKKGSLMFTVIFGMLGPVLAIHVVVYLIFAVTGWMAIFMYSQNVQLVAQRYRVWCRMSRMFALSWLLTTSTFIMSCYSFRKGMSVYEHTLDAVRHNQASWNYRGRWERELVGAARVIDDLANSNPSLNLKFPYDFFMFCGYNLGISLTFLLAIPFLYILSFLWGQERYYRWRFWPNTKIPIE